MQVVIDHLVPDGVCDYQAISDTLERLSGSKAGTALLVYPVGRTIVQRAKEAHDRLQMMNASLGALREVAETAPTLWTPDLVVSAKALVGQLREQGVQVTDVVTESVVSGVQSLGTYGYEHGVPVYVSELKTIMSIMSLGGLCLACLSVAPFLSCGLSRLAPRLTRASVPKRHD